MTLEESNLDHQIIFEQVTLQELTAEASRLSDEDEAEGKRLTLARKNKAHHAILSRLWERGRALKGESR